MIGEVVVLIALAVASYSLGVFTRLAIDSKTVTDLEARIRAVEGILATFEAEGTDEPVPQQKPVPQAKALANIAGNYGCTVIRSPSGDAYATYGSGHC